MSKWAFLTFLNAFCSLEFVQCFYSISGWNQALQKVWLWILLSFCFQIIFWKLVIEDSSSWQYLISYGYAFSLLQNNFCGWKGCRFYIKTCKSWRNRWNFEGWTAVSNSHKNQNSEIPCLICPPVFSLEGNTQLSVLTISPPNKKFKLYPSLL